MGAVAGLQASNSQLPLSDITLLNARLSAPIPINFNNFRTEGFVAVNNLLDSDGETSAGYPTPGRQINLGVKLMHSNK